MQFYIDQIAYNENIQIDKEKKNYDFLKYFWFELIVYMIEEGMN